MKARQIIQILALTAAQTPATTLSVLMDGLTPGTNGATWCFVRIKNMQWEITSSADTAMGKGKWVPISETDLEAHLVSATIAGAEYKNENAKNVMFITHCVDDQATCGGNDHYRYQIAA